MDHGQPIFFLILEVFENVCRFGICIRILLLGITVIICTTYRSQHWNFTNRADETRRVVRDDKDRPIYNARPYFQNIKPWLLIFMDVAVTTRS